MKFFPISYQGGKRNQIKNLIKYFPKDFNTFIEVFGGGGALSFYFLQKEPSIKVHYNELSKNIVEIFKILKSRIRSRCLEEKINKIPKTKEALLLHSKNRFNSPLSFVFVSLYSFSGMGGTSLQSGRIKHVLNLSDYPSILKPLKITCRNALDVIESYKNDIKAFIYLDPPYINTNCRNYEHKINIKDLYLKLNDILHDTSYKCKLMLNVNADEISIKLLGKPSAIYEMFYNINRKVSYQGIWTNY